MACAGVMRGYSRGYMGRAGQKTSDDSSHREAARAAVRQWFGHDGFRGGQEDVVAAILSGRDVMTVMPTGGGKSLCYQLPALLMDGVTLVVSPLIALMKDQVDALEARGIAATVINSSVDWPEQQRRLDGLKQGSYKLVYVAPERFRSQVFLDALARVPVRLMAIDEAHCLSQWGHDFRPDYLRLGEAREKIGDAPGAPPSPPPPPPSCATTSAPACACAIHSSWSADSPVTTSRSTSRMSAARTTKPTGCWKSSAPGKPASSIAATRKSVEDVGKRLRQSKVKAVEYHAGMDDKARKRAQELFISARP